MTTIDPPRLVLIGYRGTGKSTIGRRLADCLGWDFMDADVELERRAGCTIRDLFRQHGEPAFREREAELLAELLERTNIVLATGGGVVLRDDNRRRLTAAGGVIWLTAPADILWDRLQKDQTTADRRPDLTTAGGFAEVQTLLAVREPLYRATARWTVDATRSPDVVTADILSSLQKTPNLTARP